VDEVPQVGGDLVDHVQVQDHAEHDERRDDQHERESSEHYSPEPDEHCHGDCAEENDCLFVAGMKKMGGHDALPLSVDDLTTGSCAGRQEPGRNAALDWQLLLPEAVTSLHARVRCPGPVSELALRPRLTVGQ
jgi:hypothetical protein